MNEEILRKLDDIEDMIFTLLNEKEKAKITDKRIKDLKRKIKINEGKLKGINKEI